MLTDQDLPWDATPFLPPDQERTLDVLREAARSCRACDLFFSGTQTVFGEGPERADVMMIGEQPGDMEDRAGQPLVGPAGRGLAEPLVEAAVDRSRGYVTTVGNHSQWVGRGKRRSDSK